MKKERRNYVATSWLVVTLLLLVGCAKELPYRELVKSEFTTKVSDWDFDSEYLYAPTTGETPMFAAAIGFAQGQEKVVRFKKDENGIAIYEVEEDPRFDKEENQRPIMTIPGDYVDYRCREDGLRECTNWEEVNSELEWHQKEYFVPDYKAVKVEERNTLDFYNDLVDTGYSEVRSELLSYKMDGNSLNINIEKTYRLNKNNWWYAMYTGGWWDFDSLFRNGSFKVRYYYSFVKLSDITTRGYSTILYPNNDHTDFGFFKQERHDLDNAFTSGHENIYFRLHRWAPGKTVEFYLSQSFNNPENKVYKDAAYDVVDKMNLMFEKYDVALRLKLKEPDPNVNLGDLKVNMLNLIEDPQNGGILGYGPSVVNPKTGEIVKAHVNMYNGNFISMSRRLWEEMVDLKARQLKAQGKTLAKKIYNAPKLQGSIVAPKDSFLLNGQVINLVNRLSFVVNNPFLNKHKLPLAQNVRLTARLEQQLKSKSLETIPSVTAEEMAKTFYQAGGVTEVEKDVYAYNVDDEAEFDRDYEPTLFKRYDSLLKFLMANNAEPMESVLWTFGKIMVPGVEDIAGVLNQDGTLKRWDDLSEEQQIAARDIMIPFVWRGTLTHEIGHTIGLRHNFRGSYDKANFWTAEEMAEFGYGGDKATHPNFVPQFSSVMDYDYSALNFLPILGKYDIAALKYGYNRQVETQAGTWITVPEPGAEGFDRGGLVGFKNWARPRIAALEEDLAVAETDEQKAEIAQEIAGLTLHEYEYCTDEHSGLNAPCNPFDEGTTLPEIVQSYMASYEDNYKRTNFRDNREEFIDYGIAEYVYKRWYWFRRMRWVADEYEVLMEMLIPDYGASVIGYTCNDGSWFCKAMTEWGDAYKLVGNFFLNILKTPEHSCAVVEASNPNQLADIIPLMEVFEKVDYQTFRDLGYAPNTCFHPLIKETLANYQVLGAMGWEDKNYIPVAEAGKFTKMYRAIKEKHVYVNDISVRGTWSDKVLAMKFLMDRNTGKPTMERYHMSFIDHPELQGEIVNFLNHITVGEELTNPVPFKLENGQEIAISGFYNDYSFKIPFQPYGWIRGFMGLNNKGETRLDRVLLQQAANVAYTPDEDYRDFSAVVLKYFTLDKTSSLWSNPSSEALSIQGPVWKYSAAPDNYLAYTMIKTIQDYEYLATIDRQIVIDVYNFMANPPATASLTDAEKEAMQWGKDNLEFILGLINTENFQSVDDVTAVYGPEVGPVIFQLYSMGAESIQRVLYALEHINDIPEGATEDHIKVFNMGAQVVVAYLQGNLEALANFYYDKLQVLPEY